ncbi:uncharacterized protein METZ01_LOCUS360263 [marine metagenome]|uniref:Uncharacterized protein n=1 Tax=marine metagenome TaxID=408172 RepID=A0A382SC17_9ZZZZ
MVVPSGPGLSTIESDKRYSHAVANSDFAIPDSAYMVLLLRALKCIKIKKLSGYNFLKRFLFEEKLIESEIFLIDPTIKESKLNCNYLASIGIPIDAKYQYVAPMYGSGDIEDLFLIEKLNNLVQKPKYIIINLGSGIQEPLGLFLKQNLNFTPGIICTGAAIAFLNGQQANISPFIDKMHLGWLLRCIKNPRIFIPRYIKAIGLFKLILYEKVIINS